MTTAPLPGPSAIAQTDSVDARFMAVGADFTDLESDAQSFRPGDVIEVWSADLSELRGVATVTSVSSGLVLEPGLTWRAGDAVVLGPKHLQLPERQAGIIWTE